MSDERKQEAKGWRLPAAGVALFTCAVLAFEGVVTMMMAPPPFDGSPQAIKARITPVGRVNIAGMGLAGMDGSSPPIEVRPVSATPLRTGEQVFGSFCTVCHSSGAAGAPKVGDKAAWAPRIAQGVEVLFTHAKNGFKAMPPKGTCGSCSDEELKAAIEFMVGRSR